MRSRASTWAGYAAFVAVVTTCSLACDRRSGDTLPTTTASPASVDAAPSAVPKFEPSMLYAFAPLPDRAATPVVDEQVKLGRALFFDPRLSIGQDVSCSSCHDLGRAGTDGQALATGSKEHKGARNAPTVLNAAGSFAQGWEARYATIDELVVQHLLDPAIMGMRDERKVLDVVGSIPGYVSAFQKAFPDAKPALSAETVASALATYVKKLLTPGRWDALLRGDTAALSPGELAGLAAFTDAGCTSCHQGKYLGATQGQKLGIAKPWPGAAGTDPGRFDVTKQEVDRGIFKVPSLRNVQRTAPYLHDGSVATLEDATRLMARHQVGRELGAAQIAAIVTFLGALSGEPAKELTQKPDLPPSGPKTPKPD